MSDETPLLPWYKSGIVRQQIVAFLGSVATLLGLAHGVGDVCVADACINIEATVTAVLAAIAVLVPVWTIITRFTKPAPAITNTAASKEASAQAKIEAEATAKLLSDSKPDSQKEPPA